MIEKVKKEKVFTKTLEEEFGKTGTIGQWGEDKVENHLKELGYENIHTHRGVKRQAAGHDVSCTLHGEEHNVSVKTNLKGGVFYVEKVKGTRPGWWVKENARIYYFVEYKGKKMIEVTKEALAEFITKTNPSIRSYKGYDELYTIDEYDFLKYFKDRKECKLWED